MADQHASPKDNPKTALIRKFIDEQVTDAFLKKNGAQACGIGRDENGEPCLNFFINTNRPQIEKVVRPKKISYHDPDTNQDVDIEAREIDTGNGRLDHAPPAGPPPHVAGGAGITANESGTLGGWAWDPAERQMVLLSAHHVLGGDPGTQIFCPALILEGAVAHLLGTTLRGFDTLNGKPKVDCAIGKINDPSRIVPEVIGLGGAIIQTRDPSDGDAVVKVGLETERTHGKISVSYYHGTVDVEDVSGGFVARPFAECFLIEPTNKQKGWAQPRDSGSLVLAAECNSLRVHDVIGVHIASLQVKDEWWGIACTIKNVFDALSITTLPAGVLASIVSSAVGDGDKGDDMMDVLRGFRGVCATSEVGKHLATVLDENRAALATILATDDDLRNEAAAIFAALFGGADRVDQVMGPDIDLPTVEKIRDFGQALSRAAAGLQQRLDNRQEKRPDGDHLQAAVQVCLNDLPQAPGSTTLAALLHCGTPAAAHHK